jgi:hypothetical protein
LKEGQKESIGIFIAMAEGINGFLFGIVFGLIAGFAAWTLLIIGEMTIGE